MVKLHTDMAVTWFLIMFLSGGVGDWWKSVMVCVCIMGVDVGECGWGGLVSGGVCACVWVGKGVCMGW